MNFTQPKSLAAFLGDDEDAPKWAGVVSELGPEAILPPATPPRSTATTFNATEETEQLHFWNNLPPSKHLFFIDKVRPTEHYFQVNFNTSAATSAYFAIHSHTKRLRRVVAQDRDAISKAIFTGKSTTTNPKESQALKARLVAHLKEKNYPETSTVGVLHLGCGVMCTLGEIYVHPNRQDLIKSVRETSVTSALDALDQSLMLDVLSMGESIESNTVNNSSAASASPASAQGKDRPCTVAAHVLVFDRNWCCCNQDCITGGMSMPEVGALALHQTGVKSNQLWLNPQVPLQSVDSASSSLSKEGDSAPDPGDTAMETPDMILESETKIEYLEAVLKCAADTLKRRH